MYYNELEKCNLNNNWPPYNYLKKLIRRKWEEYDLNLEDQVLCYTICSCVRRGNLVLENQGGHPPALPESIEKVIIDTVIAMAKIRHPLCVYKTIEFANSIIEKTKHQEAIVNWKSSMFPDLPLEDIKRLGTGWRRGLKNDMAM
jgi:hypothetical protein